MTAEKTYGFVTGCSRSGTTALTRLINRHPDVAIGFERFDDLAYEGKLEPSLFETDRFNWFKEGDSHHRSYEDPERKAVLAKVGTAKTVGDKVPSLIGHLEQLDRFPNWKVVLILREPVAVARSFQRRAQHSAETGGAWPAERSYQAAVSEFNETVSDGLWLLENHPDRVMVVNFEELFVNRDQFDDLFRFLGADPAKMEPIDDIVEQTQGLIRQGQIDPIALAVCRGVDLTSYQKLSRAAGQSTDLFSVRDLERMI